MREQPDMPAGKSLPHVPRTTGRPVLALVLIAAALGLWWTVYNEDRDLRVHFLEDARMVSRAFDWKHLQQLSAGESDLTSPDYRRIKDQLTGIKQASLRTHFVYLLRQRPDGGVVILADSEPATSGEYSPPGQEYQEASAEIRQIFASGREAAIGPYSDRWGRWVSAVVPVTEPETGRTVALLGMDIGARDWYRDLARETAESMALILMLIVPLAVYVTQSRRSEQSLRLSRDEWQNTFDSMPDLIAILDTHHRIVRANRAMRHRLEQDGASILGRHCYRHVHKQDSPPDFCPHAKLLKDGGSHAEEAHLPELDGDYSVSVTPLHDAAGNLTGSIHVAHDVTQRKKAEDALRQSEALLRDAQVTAGLGTYFLDIGTGTWSSSDILDRIFGIDERFERSLPGWVSLIHPGDQDMMTRYFADEVLGKHRSFNKEYRVVRADNGRECWVHGMGRLEFDEHGHPVRMTGTIMDITSRKQAEEIMQASEEKFRLLFEKSNDAILITIPDGSIISVNAEACRMFGMTSEEFFQGGRAAIIDPDDDRFRTAFECRARTGEFKGELNFVRKNGEVFPADVSSTIFSDSSGNVRSTVRICDISERKRVEAELNRKNAEIEQFIYTVSHDLRSPLVTIKTFLGYLGQDIPGGDSDRIAKDLGFMHTAAERMETLLNELLDMSRVGRTTSPHEAVAFQELVGEALDAVAGQIMTGSVDVRVTAADLSLCGDRRRLLQIWQNLLDNALKYMGDQPEPRIEISVEQHQGETVFHVRDNGIGIDPAYHEKVFGIFEKLDRSIGGVGMGLTMVKRIVELYDGQIRVESTGNGTGTCFRFTLPGALQP